TPPHFLASRQAHPVLAVVALVAYGAAFGCGLMVVRVRGHKDLEPRTALDGYGHLPKERVLLMLAASRVKMFEHNKAIQDTKAAWWKASLAALVLGLVSSTVGLVLHTDGHDRQPEPGKSSPSVQHSASNSPAPTQPR
ncbi:hypothetical protein, partial [Kitasatospora nipponensis]|uniref:hypothetical protein n=1 Tax=Kitasatospora nipponensis TaxID=258049 RepID=UPI0031CDBEB6